MVDGRTHKSAVSFGSDGGGKDGKEAIRDVSMKKLGSMADKDGMDTLSMEVSTVEMTWFGVAGPHRS